MRLKEEHDRPIRISTSALIRESENSAVIRRHLEYLPLTAKTLDALAESRQDFAIRRIEWAAAYCHDNGIKPSRWRLIKLACVPHLESEPSIRTALDHATQNYR